MPIVGEDLRDLAPSTFRVESELSGIRILADRSVKVSFTTLTELSDADLLYLFRRQASQGWLLYSERELTERDVPDGEITSEAKSPSARVRSLLFVLWKLRYPDAAQRTLNSYESFYRAALEAFTDTVRRKISEAEGVRD